MKELRDSESSELKCNIPEVPRNALWKTNLIIYFVTKKVFFPVSTFHGCTGQNLGEFIQQNVLFLILSSFSIRQLVFI